MKPGFRTGIAVLLAMLVAGGIWLSRDEVMPEGGSPEPSRVAVEVTPVERGAIVDIRELTGTLEPQNAFTVASKIGGRVERIHADIGDAVERGGILVELDDDEASQTVAEAEAALAVSRAEHEQARSDAELAEREFERTRTLAARDLASQSDLDTARAQAAAERSRVVVAEARVRERQAALAAARVRRSYTQVRATWPEDHGQHLVGERMVSRGDTVSANEPLLSLLSIDPLKAVIFASEGDYPALSRGQPATVVAEALPEREFDGEVARLAPRFDEASRQARVEIRVPNPEHTLKPGMFVTVRVDVGRAEDAPLVPVGALTRLGGEQGVYRVVEGDDGPRARFVPVTVGIEGDDRVEIRAPELDGRVVTLGQQLLEDDAPIRIAGEASE